MRGHIWSLVIAFDVQVGRLIGRFGKAYPDLQPRISRQLLKAFLDPAKSLGTHYGELFVLVTRLQRYQHAVQHETQMVDHNACHTCCRSANS